MRDNAIQRFRSRMLPLLACVVLAGCGGTYDSYVSGTVTLDGATLPRGTVAFSPQSPGAAAYGRIDSDGQYTIQTGREEGLASGHYLATVVANELPDQEGRDGGPPPAGKPITPPWYRSAKTSGLEFTVEPGSNTIDISLTSEPPADWKPPKQRRR
ncbi:MAG: carboxypeptidase regulatory-like domain-containing protein [Planctomycetales bacterium]|nr:carboxypeptidase regulatory-like domain-containing protein [Planctomycetales bacterium]